MAVWLSLAAMQLIEKDAVVNGDVVVVGGNLTIDGDIYGNVAIIGGNLTLSGKIDGILLWSVGKPS